MPAPPVSALSQLETLDPKLTEQVRDRFLDEARKNPDRYDKHDLEQIRQNQWQTQRFLLECKLKVDQAYEAMRLAMEWRHQQGVHRMTAGDFPAEYYQSGYIFPYERDRNGAVVLYFRANIHRKTEWNERLKQFFIYRIEQIDLHADGKGVTLVIDCSNIGISNVDVDLLKFIVTSFSKYYPKLFDAIIIHQLPFLLQYLFKLVQSWLPEDDRKFFHMTTKKTLTDFIDQDRLPSFLIGSKHNGNDESVQSWQLLSKKTIDDDGDSPILPAKEFVQKHGERFHLKAGDENKLDYLRSYIK